MWLVVVVLVVALALILGVVHQRGRVRPPAKVERLSSSRALPEQPSLSVPTDDRPVELDVDLTLVTSSSTSGYGRSVSALLAEVMREQRYGAEREAVVPLADGEGASRAIVICEDDAVGHDEAAGPGARIQLSACADSDQGLRRKRNEDSFLVLEQQALFVVADGMGGYEGGQVASSLAVKTISSCFGAAGGASAARDPRLPRRARELACAVVQANRAVFAASHSDRSLSQMGTTLIAACFEANEQRVYIGHVGDSRCYRLREQRLRLLTTDHTLRQLGTLDASANQLTRAIGQTESIDVDVVVDRPRPNDIYLLCSDGLSKMVSDARIRELLLEQDDLERALYALIEAANDAGGRDNVTVILIRVAAANRGRPEHRA